VYTGGSAARLVSRVYLDSLRYGIARTYWYAWDTPILGIDMIDSRGRVTAGGRAFSTLRSWVVGLHWNGCVTAADAVSRCALTTAAKAERTIIYTAGSAVRTHVPTHATRACTIDNKCRAVTPGATLVANASPQYFVGG
jgi:hypothetical protein